MRCMHGTREVSSYCCTGCAPVVKQTRFSVHGRKVYLCGKGLLKMILTTPPWRCDRRRPNLLDTQRHPEHLPQGILLRRYEGQCLMNLVCHLWFHVVKGIYFVLLSRELSYLHLSEPYIHSMVQAPDSRRRMRSVALP